MSKFDFRPYVSGDLEFTSLDKEVADITQMGFVFDTGDFGDVRTLPHFHCFIEHDTFNTPEATALYYNIPYLTERMKHKKGESSYDWMTPKMAVHTLCKFLRSCAEVAINDYDKKRGWERPIRHVQIFGKNFGYTDAHVLLNFTKRECPEKYAELEKLIGYHFGDAGSAMMPYFGYIPGLSAINEKTGRKAVSHDAYDDALDVVFGIRAAYCGVRAEVSLRDTTYDSKQGAQ